MDHFGGTVRPLRYAIYSVALLLALVGNIAEDIRERTVPGMCSPDGCFVDWWFIPSVILLVALITSGLAHVQARWHR